MANFKLKYTSISPEEVECNKRYPFTLNPEHQAPIDAISNRLTAQTQHLEQHLKLMWGCQIVVNIEVSQLGRIHYHGWITITNIKYFYLNDIELLKKYGTFSITTELPELKGKESKYKTWEEYITKQSKIWGDMYQGITIPKVKKEVCKKPKKIQKIDDVIEPV